MKWLRIVSFSAKSWFRIRGGIVGPLVFLGIMFLIEGSFWVSLARSGEVGTYDLDQLLFYAFAALTVSQLVAVSGEPDSLSEKIESGELDLYLIRPRSVIRQLLEVQLGYTFARMIFALPILMILVFVSPSVNAFNIVLALPILFFASVINAAMNMLIANLTFWFRESYAFVVVKETLFWMLSGTLLPLDLFPGTLRYILEHLPPAYTVYLPVQLILGRGNVLEVLLGQIVTLGLLYMAAVFVFRCGVSRYQAYGS